MGENKFFNLRQGLPSDGGFIAQHWVDAYKNSMPRPWVSAMDAGVFKRFCHRAIEGILAKAEIRIAEPKDGEVADGDGSWRYILGAAVVQRPDTVHFVYVRKEWRQRGLAQALLRDFDIPTCTITTWSPAVSGPDGWIRTKYSGFRYVPFYMQEGDEERRQKAAQRYTYG